MATFDYKILAEIHPISAPSQSVFTNSAATASYVRTIVLHNVSASNQTTNIWKVGNGNNPIDANRIFSVVVSGSGTYLIEFTQPGLLMTGSGDTLWASVTNDKGVNIAIMGGQE